jgi:ATP-binding cassette subfamily C protein
MQSADTRPGKARRKRRSQGILRIFFTAPPLRAALVMLCLLLAGLAEGVGVATMLPVLTIAGGNAGGQPSWLEGTVRHALDVVGLPTDLVPLLFVVIGGLWLKAGLSMAAMNYVGYQVAEVATRLRLDLIERLLRVRWSYYVRQPVGRFTNAISSEATRAGEAYMSVASLIQLLMQAGVYIIISLLVRWELTLVSLAVGGIITLSLNRLVRTARQAGRNQTRRTQLLVQRLSDTLIGIKPLKAMAKHVRMGALFAVDARALRKAFRRQIFSKQAMRALQEPLLAVFLCAGIYVAVNHLAMPITELLFMAGLMMNIVLTINRAQQAYQTATLSESAFWAIRDTIAEAEAEREVSAGRRAPTLEKACVFDDVTFGFDGRPILRNVSFAIKAGEITTVTGASGAGKTTIVDLLLRLHRPDAGAIRVDDVPLDEIDLVRWREMMGYVPQEVILFHDSVLANVTLGDPAYGKEEARAALAAAGAWDFVAQMPEGLDSIVGERGALLSGGQRQRIAVARALIHAPALLILDEATSALDPATEAGICRNLKDLVAHSGLTIVAISHQPAWVEAADRVYHLEHNQVNEVPAEAPRVAAS